MIKNGQNSQEMREICSNYYFIVNGSYLTQNLTVLGVLGLVLNLTGMAFHTRTRTRRYPYRLPAGVPIPLTFTKAGRPTQSLSHVRRLAASEKMVLVNLAKLTKMLQNLATLTEFTRFTRFSPIKHLMFNVAKFCLINIKKSSI
jgi:hypothetical protein